MEPDAIIFALKRRGVDVRVSDGRLILEYAENVQVDDIKGELKKKASEVIEYLNRLSEVQGRFALALQKHVVKVGLERIDFNTGTVELTEAEIALDEAMSAYAMGEGSIEHVQFAFNRWRKAITLPEISIAV